MQAQDRHAPPPRSGLWFLSLCPLRATHPGAPSIISLLPLSSRNPSLVSLCRAGCRQPHCSVMPCHQGLCSWRHLPQQRPQSVDQPLLAQLLLAQKVLLTSLNPRGSGRHERVKIGRRGLICCSMLSNLGSNPPKVVRAGNTCFIPPNSETQS